METARRDSGRLMQPFRIHMINSEFQSCDDSEHDSLEAALKAGIAAAAKVATEAIAAGHQNSAVEIRIEQNGEVVERRVLTFSVSDLMVGSTDDRSPR